MTPEQQAAYVMGEAMAAFIEAQSMIVANKEREMQGKAYAYGEEAFLALQTKYCIRHNAMLTLFQGR